MAARPYFGVGTSVQLAYLPAKKGEPLCGQLRLAYLPAKKGVSRCVQLRFGPPEGGPPRACCNCVWPSRRWTARACECTLQLPVQLRLALPKVSRPHLRLEVRVCVANLALGIWTLTEDRATCDSGSNSPRPRIWSLVDQKPFKKRAGCDTA